MIDREFGRKAFGANPAAYQAARPSYPEWVFETLREKCGLAPGVAAFEIGAGTGSATNRLIELGASPLIAIEPDHRMAAFLRESIRDEALAVINSTFEEAELEEAAFDLGVSATAFHWLDEEVALAQIARILKAGGWWAALWNVFGDDSLPDPFHEATNGILGGPPSPSAGTNGISFALDVESRVAALERNGAFDSIEYRESKWPLVLNADQVVALYATYSNLTIRDDQEAILAELGRVARDQFDNHVTRNMTTSLYIARRTDRGE